MKIEELEKWIATDEGKKWLDEKKQSLIEKRDRLLDELANIKKRLADAEGKGNALASKIDGYLTKLKNEYCMGCFDDVATFQNRLIPDKELREFVLSKIEKLAEADGGLIAGIDDDGKFNLATADGKGFSDYYSEWLNTDVAKSYIYNPACGGGAKGSNFGGSNGGFTRSAIEKMTPQEVAKNLDNPNFRQGLKS